MNRIAFNTHRPYTAEGQVIVAEVVNGSIVFHDTSRMVMGRIAVADAHELRDITRWPHRFIDFVLRAYDLCTYTGISSDEAPKRAVNETLHHYA